MSNEWKIMIVSSRSQTNTRSRSDSGPGDGSGRRPPCFFALLDSERENIQTVHILYTMLEKK